MRATRILAATDGSDDAMRAVEAAARLASATGAELVLVTVGKEQLSAEESHEARRQGLSPGDALEMLAQRTLAEARQQARSAGASAIRLVDTVGDPAQSILEIAEREHPDLLFVGRRGRGRVAGMLLGSVSQKLACEAGCAVVVVP